MKTGLKGQALFTVQRTVDSQKLNEVAAALDSASGAATASLVPFFGPTVGGEERFVACLGLDLTRSLLGGLSYEWVRPFREHESVTAELSVEDFYEKAGMQFVVVLISFVDDTGQPIHTQRATFIERGAA